MMKKLAKKIIQGHKASSAAYIEHLRKIGMEIGEDVSIMRRQRRLSMNSTPG